MACFGDICVDMSHFLSSGVGKNDDEDDDDDDDDDGDDDGGVMNFRDTLIPCSLAP